MKARTRALASAALALGILIGLGGCANISHRNEIQSAARAALLEAGLAAGAEAFDTGEGLADRYALLVCTAVPQGQEYDDRAKARAIAETLNAVREVALGHEGRVQSVSIRLTDSSAEQGELDTWCRGDTRTLGIDEDVVELVSVPVDRVDWDSADFEAPYPEAELLAP